jgi:hypothetical protein
MINIIKKIFGIHIHDYEKWQEIKVYENGPYIICMQKRVCKTCGYTEVSRQSI